MTRRRLVYPIATALAAAMAFVTIVGYRSSSSVEDASASNATRDRGTVANNSPVPRGAGLRARHVLPSPPGRRVDIARVEAALARLEATTARITPEQLADEQMRMAEAKAWFEAIKVPEPTTREFTDDHGLRWIELRHASGEVRYMLAPVHETPSSSPGSVR